jgi:hypothetical protein
MYMYDKNYMFTKLYLCPDHYFSMHIRISLLIGTYTLIHRKDVSMSKVTAGGYAYKYISHILISVVLFCICFITFAYTKMPIANSLGHSKSVPYM